MSIANNDIDNRENKQIEAYPAWDLVHQVGSHLCDTDNLRKKAKRWYGGKSDGVTKARVCLKPNKSDREKHRPQGYSR